MDHLPLSDIPMLVSSINFLLRDEEFENLDQICYCFGVERDEMASLNQEKRYFTMNYQQIKDWMENYELWD